MQMDVIQYFETEVVLHLFMSATKLTMMQKIVIICAIVLKMSIN